MLAIVIITFPRMRACTFSSAVFGAVPENVAASIESNASCAGSIGMSQSGMPKFAASVSESDTLPTEEYRDGMLTPTTFPAPSASAAITATTAESMPPDMATATFEKPVLRT